ncbi:hypothetical protein KVR01_009028 [Diaporthe batatas]|uniref:uncharacterized protein n=1 Tax=Diaporthe batatas TaxID=748121 RepID=UPI001D057465|nr:uncharacterized protein KVR01_009028 [Diaporthe batatas]KAG8160764.1 hypothetical protein KVR01_009028 [Diaporthe batatas]
MVVTTYETKTDGKDGLGLLTTLERASPTVTVTGALELSTISDLSEETAIPPTSTAQTSSATRTSSPGPISTSTTAPSPTQLSTASIVGIALGSVAGGVLVLVCLLFAFGFRVQCAKRRRHITPTEAPQLTDDHPAAELADSEYLKKVERLHKGTKPELEGSTTLESLWGLFSARPLRTGGLRGDAAEIAAGPLNSVPHELPGDGMMQPRSEEPRDTQNAT